MHTRLPVVFRILTFNAGLAVGVLPHSTARVEPIILALAALDLDLLFVQEFWLQAHWERLRHELRSRLPYALRLEPTGPQACAACREADLASLRDCAQRRCAGLSDEALARCVVQHCATQALALPTPCLNCIASQPTGSLEEIFERCLAPETSEVAEVSSVADTGRLIAYGGSFGTGLLSRLPFEDTETLVFEASVNARGALRATLRPEGFDLLHVFAVHLSPGGVEQGVQVKQLIQWIDRRSHASPTILLGDLNTTPGSVLFRQFEEAGFVEADPSDRSSTFGHHGLGTGQVQESGYRLDHILVRNLEARIRTERALHQPVTISVAGEPIRTTLSDHFGVSAHITRG